MDIKPLIAQFESAVVQRTIEYAKPYTFDERHTRAAAVVKAENRVDRAREALLAAVPEAPAGVVPVLEIWQFEKGRQGENKCVAKIANPRIVRRQGEFPQAHGCAWSPVTSRTYYTIDTDNARWTSEALVGGHKDVKVWKLTVASGVVINPEAFEKNCTCVAWASCEACFKQK